MGSFNKQSSLSDDGKQQSASKISAHERGLCTACRFFNSPQGCRHGQDCSFCHEDHVSRSKSRRKRWHNRGKLMKIFGVDNLKEYENIFGGLPSRSMGIE